MAGSDGTWKVTLDPLAIFAQQVGSAVPCGPFVLDAQRSAEYCGPYDCARSTSISRRRSVQTSPTRMPVPYINSVISREI